MIRGLEYGAEECDWSGGSGHPRWVGWSGAVGLGVGEGSRRVLTVENDQYGHLVSRILLSKPDNIGMKF